jgi:DNA-binding NtrC family response regulator
MMSRDARAPVLVIDDEPDLREALTDLLRDGYVVHTAPDAETGLERLRTERPRCILLDLTLPGMDGIGFLEHLKERDLQIPVIVLTGRKGDVPAAVKAMQLGAVDYKTKPWNPDDLRIAVARAVEHSALRQRVEAFEEARAGRRVAFDNIITRSPEMKRVLGVAQSMADTDARVLITGETGTGKELLAKALHDSGARRGHTFVAVNCAAIPGELAESEFFGHEKGAFTGAVKAKRGKFELAHEGTIFLDEVTCLPLDLQAKLLRVLQDGIVDRVGGESPTRVDARVIAATNADPRAEVAAGRFREDLYYRLNVVPLHIPPLRERREDIPVLLEHFRGTATIRTRRTIRGYTPEAMRLLTQYDWPGNVRELEHTVERLVVLEHSLDIGIDHLPVDIVSGGHGRGSVAGATIGAAGEIEPLRVARANFERQYITSILARHGWNQTRAAATLGVNRNTLITKMQQLGIRPPGARGRAPAADRTV